MIASQRLKLAMLWWIWGGALILILAILSDQPVLFGNDLSAVWQWFLPNLIPTLTLVSAVIAFDGLPAGLDTQNKHLFYVALAASVLYLLLLSVSVISVLFVTDPIGVVHRSNFWLGPVQGLSASTTGVFFAKQHGP